MVGMGGALRGTDGKTRPDAIIRRLLCGVNHLSVAFLCFGASYRQTRPLVSMTQAD
jgi:hypothetical protein